MEQKQIKCPRCDASMKRVEKELSNNRVQIIFICEKCGYQCNGATIQKAQFDDR